MERRKWREVDQRATEKGGEKSWRSVDEFQAGGIFISVGTYVASIERGKKKKLPVRSFILTEMLHQLA